MKAKYYLGCSILEASIGKRLSFAWSIPSSCDLLREGLIWRVGNVLYFISLLDELHSYFNIWVHNGLD
jgi:hypothetical protein